MKSYQRTALLACAGFVLICGAAAAQVIPAPPAADMYGPGRLHGRLGERALRDFDLNKDGKITKAEIGKALSQRFSRLAAGKETLSEAELASAHEAMLHQHSDSMFRRDDWSGDGVLSLSEFRAPLRDHFSRADHDGSGSISCKSDGRHQGAGGGAHHSRNPGQMHSRERHAHHLRGRNRGLCLDADLNRDGKVTRAEFDKVVADKYAAAVHGGKGMTAAEYYEVELARFHNMEAKRFKRLDKNHDGKLTEAEFAAPGKKLFARLDKNNDGVLDQNELGHHRQRRHGNRV